MKRILSWLSQRFDNAVDSVAGNAEYRVDAPVNKCLYDYISCSFANCLPREYSISRPSSFKSNVVIGRSQAGIDCEISAATSEVEPALLSGDIGLRAQQCVLLTQKAEMILKIRAPSRTDSAIDALLHNIDTHIQDGRFQRSMALVTAGSSFVSGA